MSERVSVGRTDGGGGGERKRGISRARRLGGGGGCGGDGGREHCWPLRPRHVRPSTTRVSPARLHRTATSCAMPPQLKILSATIYIISYNIPHTRTTPATAAASGIMVYTYNITYNVVGDDGGGGGSGYLPPVHRCSCPRPPRYWTNGSAV